MLDKYIEAKVVVPGKYPNPVIYQVKQRKLYAEFNPIGEEHSNLILDTRLYEL